MLSTKNEIIKSSNSEEDLKKKASDPNINIVAEHMVNKLAGFQFSLPSKAAIKPAANVFLDMARQFNLNFPEDDKKARRSMGHLIFSDRRMDLSSLEFCSKVCELFGANQSGCSRPALYTIGMGMHPAR